MYINVERTAILLSSTSDLEKIKTDTGLDIQGNAGQNKIEFCLTGMYLSITLKIPQLINCTSTYIFLLWKNLLGAIISFNL